LSQFGWFNTKARLIAGLVTDLAQRAVIAEADEALVIQLVLVISEGGLIEELDHGERLRGLSIRRRAALRAILPP
jgi:hypothetical protein